MLKLSAGVQSASLALAENRNAENLVVFMNPALKLHLLAAKQEMTGLFCCLITCPKFLAGFRIIGGGLGVFRRKSFMVLEATEETVLEMTSLDPQGSECAVWGSEAASERFHPSAKELLPTRVCIHPFLYLFVFI